MERNFMLKENAMKGEYEKPFIVVESDKFTGGFLYELQDIMNKYGVQSIKGGEIWLGENGKIVSALNVCFTAYRKTQRETTVTINGVGKKTT